MTALAVTLFPAPVTGVPYGVVWSTPECDIDPPIATAGAEAKVTMTLCAPVATPFRPYSATYPKTSSLA